MGCSSSRESQNKHKVLPTDSGCTAENEEKDTDSESKLGPLPQQQQQPRNNPFTHQQQLRSIDPSSATSDGHAARKPTTEGQGDEKLYWDGLGSLLLHGSGKTIAMSSLVGKQFTGNMVRMPSRKKPKQ